MDWYWKKKDMDDHDVLVVYHEKKDDDDDDRDVNPVRDGPGDPPPRPNQHTHPTIPVLSVRVLPNVMHSSNSHLPPP